MFADSWAFGVNGPNARLLDPLAVLKRDVAGLNVIETKGVVDVDVVLAGGETGEVVVNQLRTWEDLSWISIAKEVPFRGTWMYRTCLCCRDTLYTRLQHCGGCRSFHRQMAQRRRDDVWDPCERDP
jgi:hypothetical protein